MSVDAATLERWEGLRSVRLARTVLEEAWGLSLILTTDEGPLAHRRGGVVRSSGPSCRAALFSREGFTRCDTFYRGVREGESRCHLGLQVWTEPVVIREGDAPVAHLVVSGFSSPAEEVDRAQVAHALSELGVDDATTADAARKLPVVDPASRRPVRAVLRVLAEELRQHERGRDEERRARPVGLWGLVGQSPQMEAVFELLPRLAASDATVLVLGESGTGKELVARALHDHGNRKSRPFVAQNCAAMPDDLLESALFGHVRGAFSGASRSQEGLFGAADGGTLFLDEVGEMSPALQVKLLRVLQDGSYLPVGATAPRKANVRIVAATHRDLARGVEEGTFRQDLFYRLHVLPIRLPPLRERLGDLRSLVDAFVADLPPTVPRRVADATWECLEHYRWPGNVRELRAEVFRWQITAADATELRPEHLSPEVGAAAGYTPVGSPTVRAAVRGEATLAEAVESLEREIISEGLTRTGGNRTRLAKELGISRTTLGERLKRYGFD
ncbi:MAG: sigma 54-interacting transcriptional regulator [Sandaracinus sp.]|nr:sigma 54-interacting transcriptional regulator [Sandaracinus sp.]MCB9632560.1 sigma 54-interacting transcriptional regulator [Sandaracinus sp.]